MKFLLPALALIGVLSTAAAVDDRPNVVIFFIDDNAFSNHGSEGALAAVRSGRYKLFLSPAPTLYDLESDPGESKPVRSGEIIRKLRGMAVMFQEEMSRDARQAGEGARSVK